MLLKRYNILEQNINTYVYSIISSVTILLLALCTKAYEFVCSYGACTVSNIDISYDGLYVFTFIANASETLILRGATGKLVNLTILQNVATLKQIIIEDCKFMEIIIPQFQIPFSLVLRRVFLKAILIHQTANMLTDIRMRNVPFKVFPPSLLQLQHLVSLEQCRSHMRYLHFGDLKNMHSLTNLDLSYNKIQSVIMDRNGQCCGQLKYLNLKGNLLKRFDFGALVYLSQLKCAFLGYNQISSINTRIEQHYNRNRKFCSWKTFYVMRIKANIPVPRPACTDYFANLSTITLDHNRLTEVNMNELEHMSVLTDLDLAFNPIENVKISNDRIPVSLNMSLLNGNRGYLHALAPDVFSN
ncbi:leucine-rich repeat-containing protein 70-like [Anopheles marshallii]|uniref:leucine-rich repeat-containing protein 70-like n=1 Tax=Anopheles marshallii TaxID=1521116 RepID=UPI00237A9950|nr:leucine-rich repeat-containing protein 70-like [Anopheles marshallii]